MSAPAVTAARRVGWPETRVSRVNGTITEPSSALPVQATTRGELDRGD